MIGTLMASVLLLAIVLGVLPNRSQEVLRGRAQLDLTMGLVDSTGKRSSFMGNCTLVMGVAFPN